MKHILFIAVSIVVTASASAQAADPLSESPKPIPTTRPEIKTALEALKDRQPRLPLPAAPQGEASVNNGRMRTLYLPESWVSGGSRSQKPGQSFRGRWQDPNSKLDYGLTRACFWVVSRGNNCHYCLGHQELALRHAGFDDDEIAAIDIDWSGFDPRQQASLAFARKLTLEPHLVDDADIAALKKQFTDAEIIELAYNIARFNATNRWTDGLGIPQDRRMAEAENSFVTPTSEKFLNTVSIVSPTTRAARSLPEMRELEQEIEDCHRRQPRVALPSDEDARKALAGVIGERSPTNWERALSQLPVTGPTQVAALNAIMTDEHLAPRLKAEIFLISAIHNRAWYGAGHAAHRLHAGGVSHDELVAMFQGDAGATPGEAAAHRLATKSTIDPHLVTDADIAAVREHYSDAETAQIVQVICMANLFDRFTESLGLPLE